MATQLQLQYFAVLTLTKLHLTNAVIIRTTSNNPVHLTCYYTDKLPHRHSTTRELRGTSLPWGAYWCFVAWLEAEQLEAGDTLIHTFVIPSWSINQHRWWVFRGTINTELSPSASGIFDHHHTGQDLILNPGFEDWSAPAGDAPDYWEYPPAPHHNLLYPDAIIKTEGDYSCRCDGQAAFGNYYIWQDLDPTILSNIPLTFRMAYRGKLHFTNNCLVRAVGDVIRQAIAFPTLDYQWEYFNLPLIMPPNLTSLYIRAQNFNQGDPLPFQTWWDNCLVYYTP